MKNDGEIKVGDYVKFTGHGYRRAQEYKYAELFGDKRHRVIAVKTSCCNYFLVFGDVAGMYSVVFFEITQ